MTLSVACGWSLVRSILIVLVALGLCRPIHRSLAQRTGLNARVAWVLLLIPFFTPELLTGYAYANFSLGLVRYPIWNELFYGLLLLMKVLPVGVLLLHFAPPPALDAAGLHCARLARRQTGGWFQRLARDIGFQVRGPFRTEVPAFAVMFLLAFQEFEMASAMGTTSWTVWLFDQRAGGLELWESLKKSVLPVCLEMIVLIPAVILAISNGRLPSAQNASIPPTRRLTNRLVGSYLAAAVFLVTLFPLLTVVKGAASGFSVILRDFAFGQRILNSSLMGLIAGLAAFWMASWLIPLTSRQRIAHWRIVLAVIACLPGLLGTLILGLVLLAVFQLPGLVSAYNTPIPLFIDLILYLVPRALLLHLLLQAVRPQEPLFLAERLTAVPARARTGRELMWQMRFRGLFGAAVLLCFWAYLDVTAATLLRPSGMETAPVLLYNFMHFGQTAILSAMLCATVAFPAILVLCLLAARRHVLSWVAS